MGTRGGGPRRAGGLAVATILLVGAAVVGVADVDMPVQADSGDLLALDPAAGLDVLGDPAETQVAIADGPTAYARFVNSTTTPIEVSGASADYDSSSYEPAKQVLVDSGYGVDGLESQPTGADAFTLDGSLPGGCDGAVLQPSEGCVVRLRTDDPSGVRGAVVVVGGPSGQLARTYVFWPSGTGSVAHDQLADAELLPTPRGVFPAAPGGGLSTLDPLTGTTVDMTAEFDEPDHVGVPAERSRWYRLAFPGPGRFVADVQSTEGVRAALYRIPGTQVHPLAGTLVAPGVSPTLASAVGSGTSFTVEAPVDDQSTYFLAVDDLGAPADFTVTPGFETGTVGLINDAFASAEEVSALDVPAYVAGAGGQPVNTVSVTGTTVGSTREPFEFGTVTNPDGSETPPPNGTVWYRFTAPTDGFSGRLGFRVSPGFFVTPLAQNRFVATPSPRNGDVNFAPGNTWPPSGLQFARMEPGHTVWFQVQAGLNSDDTWTDGEFTLEFFQGPNEQDAIDVAYDVQGADTSDSTGRPWSDPFFWGGDGDTFHTTADQPGGPRNMWFTATFDRPGFWSFVAQSETAAGGPSERPLGLRLFRSSTAARVADPAGLAELVASDIGSVQPVPFRPNEKSWAAQLVNVPVQPGRYYWSVDQGSDGPTFYSLSSQFSGYPGASTLVRDCTGGIGAFGSASTVAGTLVPASLPTSGIDYVGSASTPDLTARVAAFASDPSGDTVPSTCTPSARARGELYLDTADGSTAPVEVPTRIRFTGSLVGALGEAAGVSDMRVDQHLVANVRLIDSTDGRAVVAFDRDARRTLTKPVGASGDVTQSVVTRLNGTSVPGGDSTVSAPLSCTASPVVCSPPTVEMQLDPTPLEATAQLIPGRKYFISLEVSAEATARSADTTTPTRSTAFVDATNSLAVAFVPPTGTTVRCSAAPGLFCPKQLPGTPADTTPPTITVNGIVPGGTVEANEPTVTITSDEPLAVVDCTLDVVRDDTGASSSNPVGCGEGAFTFPSLPDGSVTLTVVGRDAAGNATTVTLQFSLQAPPEVTITSPVNGAVYAPGAVPDLAYTCTDNNGTIGDETPSIGANGDPWPGSPPSTPGIWRINVDCTDVLGNGATAFVTYSVVAPDTTAPETVIDAVSVTGRDVSVGFSGSDDGPGPLTFECAVATFSSWVPGAEQWQPCVSPTSFPNLAEGYYVVSVRSRDAAANVDATPAIRAFTVDVSPPQVVISSPVNGSTFLTGEVPQLFWVCSDLDIDTSLLAVTVNGAPLVGEVLPSTPGTYTVAVRCVDRVGLATTATSTYTVVAPDTTPPTITITGIAPGGVATTASPTVTISSDEPLVNVLCNLETPTAGGGSVSNDIGCLAPGATSGPFTFPDLRDGSVTLTVTGFDEAGNQSTATLTFSVEVLPTATLTAPADGAVYLPSQVPTSVVYSCSDNGVITSEEVQLVPQGGGQPTLLAGRPPKTPGTYTIRVVCVDGLGEEATATATYTVEVPTVFEVAIRDVQDDAPVVGACGVIRKSMLFFTIDDRRCDTATGPAADGAADGVIRWEEPLDGPTLIVEPLPQPPTGGRFQPILPPISITPDETTRLDLWSYRCASTCLWVQPKLADGSEPTVPVWPQGVAGDLVQPVPLVTPGATSPPPFPTAFVIPNLTPGVATDIPVVADDFGRPPLEVGRIRVTPTAGLNRLEPLTILPAHTITATLQRPDGSALDTGGSCLQLRGVSPVRAPRVLCTEAGSDTLRWRALPGFYVVEVAAGTVLPNGFFAPVLPANVPDNQSERTVEVVFRTSQGGTVTVAPLNFQFAPIAQLPAVAPPACEIGLFLLVNGTQAASPTATACFGSGPNPAPAVMVAPPGTYVVSRTSTWNVPGLTTGSNLVTVGAGESVSTDLTLFDPSTAGDVPTAAPDTATARPGLGVTAGVLANDTDPTGQPLTTEIVTAPTQGTASVTGDGRIAYLAAPTATGTDTVRYAAVDPWGNRSESTLTITVDPWAALSVGLATDPPPPIARNVRFDQVVTITNSSGRAASSATVAVTLPTGVVYDAPVAAPASCGGISPGSAGTLLCTVGAIAAGGTTTVRIPTRVVARPGSQQLTLEAVLSSADCADTDSTVAGNQCSAVSTTVPVPRSPVTVSVSSSAASVAPSGGFRYFVDVTNSGPVRADVDLVMDLPPEAGMIGLGPLPGPASCTFTPALAGGSAGTPDVTTRCRFLLAAGANYRFTIDAVAKRVPAAPTLALVASATSLDCTPGTDAVAEPCGPVVTGGPTVTAATLRATYVQTFPAPGTNLRVGDTVRFRAGIRNDGPIAARQPQVQVQLPPELGMVGISQQPGVPFSCSFAPALGAQPTPRVLTSCGFQALAAGASVSFEIEARVLDVPVAPAAPVSVRVSSVDCADTSAAAGAQCDTIAEGPGVVRTTLAPTVTMTPANPAVGDTVSIAFTTQNIGTVPARSLRTRLVLPADLAMTALTEFTGDSSCSFTPPLAGGGTPAVTTACAHPDLAPGATNVVRVSAVVQSLPASGAFDVRGEVGSVDCRDVVAGDARRTCATALLPTATSSLPAAFGGLTLRASTGTISSLQPIESSVLPISPSGVAFPYGAMAFTVTDVPVGGSAEIFVGVTDVLAGYWKLTATGWSQYPSSRPVSGGLVFTLVDGGAGDADGIANGIIVDPGAVGVPNVGPTAPDRTVSTPIDTPVTIDVLTGASDSDGGVPEVVDATDGGSGRVAVTPSDVTYTPDPGTTGDDTFTVRIGDGQGGLATITVTVEVGKPGAPPPPPPVVPIGVADAYRATAGTALEVPARGVLANDRGVDLIAELVDGPSVGSLTLRPDGSFTYLAPPSSTAGTVTFTYRPSGPTGIGEQTTVSIDVAAPDDTYTPRVSTRRDRGASTSLTGAVLSGSVAIFVPTVRDIARVEWFLDDPAMTGRPRQVERYAPYDFAGTAANGTARLLSTRTLGDGPHSVTARVVRRDGSVVVTTSTFVVSNPRPPSRVLTVSSSARRTSARPLDGATVSGPVAVFVPSEADIDSVRFTVDGVEGSTERFAAYDLGTTAPNGTARLVSFPSGTHTVTAKIRFDDGFVDTLTATFTATSIGGRPS